LILIESANGWESDNETCPYPGQSAMVGGLCLVRWEKAAVVRSLSLVLHGPPRGQKVVHHLALSNVLQNQDLHVRGHPNQCLLGLLLVQRGLLAVL